MVRVLSSLPSLVVVALVLILPLPGGCVEPSPVAQVAQDLLVNGNTEFALALYGEVSRQPGNVVISPISVSVSSAMLCAGAASATETEIASALRFALPKEELHAEFENLLNDLDSRVARWATLSFANGLWLDDDCAVLPQYRSVLAKRYGAEAQTVDFESAHNEACQSINDWVSSETHGKISSVVAPQMFTDLTRAVLVNTVYFLAAWEHGFADRNTRSEPFHLSDGDTVQVEMMHRKGTYHYYEDEMVQVLELRYQGSGLSMLAILPAPELTLAHVEDQLTPALLSSWVEGLEQRGVRVAIPRFEVAHRVDLIPVLGRLGMKSVFEWGSADLTGICDDPDLYVDHAVHEATLGITERGTEAAAATVFVATLGEEWDRKPEVEFTADQPFMYVVRDMKRGTILFMGRVVDPSEGVPSRTAASPLPESPGPYGLKPGWREVVELAPKIAAGAPDSMRAEFAEQLCIAGFETVRDGGIRQIVEEHFDVFAPLLVQYQMPTGSRSIDVAFHRWYLDVATEADYPPMAEALRGRLRHLCECLVEAGDSPWDRFRVQERIMICTDLLVEYGDEHSLPIISELTAPLLECGFAEMSTQDFRFWWHLDHAAKRIQGDDRTRLLRCREDGSVDVLRDCREVLTSTFWGRIELDQQMTCDVIAALDEARCIPIPEFEYHGRAIHLMLDDGTRAQIAWAGTYTYAYRDNHQYLDEWVYFECPELSPVFERIDALLKERLRSGDAVEDTMPD